jgi:heme/copper-type cytochrome/quinol oxidase subunit 1
LLGFSVLIFNIIISNYFLNKEVKKKDKKITQADINWILAKFENNTVKNKEEDTNQRVNSNFDILKNVSEIEKILGVGELKMDIQENKVSLRKYNKVSYVLFSIGSTLIVLSVIIKPVFEFLKKLALYLC